VSRLPGLILPVLTLTALIVGFAWVGIHTIRNRRNR